MSETYFKFLKPFRNKVITTIESVRASVPPFFFYYCVLYLIFQFLLFVFWVPGNDFDSMALYIPTLKIQEYGSLKQAATVDMQYLFPLIFYQLHKPLFEFGYFTTLPNFSLFLTLIVLLFGFHKKQLYPFFLFLIFSCQLLLTQSIALKHDIPVGILAFVGWFAATRLNNKTLYLTVCTIILAALVGIKWHGILPAFLLAILMVFTIVNKKLINVNSILLFLTFFPFLWILSDGKTYLNNYLDYGKVFPTISSIGSSMSVNLTPISIFKNIYIFLSSNFFDTFNGLFLILDEILGTHILEWIGQITFNSAMTDTIRVTWPSPIYTSYGISIIILLICNIYVIFKNNFSFSTKSAALISTTYICVLLLIFNYSFLFSRYCLPTFILGIVPTAEVLARFFKKPQKTYKIWLKRVIISYAILVSFHCLILTQEKPLVDLTSKGKVHMASIWHHIRDRDMLYVYSWRGYMEVYEYFREHILPSDSLLFINNTQELVFTYPFLKDRHPANTLTGSAYNPQGYAQHLGKFDYVMLYRGILEDERYEKVYTYSGRYEINIYQLKGF